MIVAGLFHTASEMEDAGAPYDVLGRLYESLAQTMLIQAGVTVDLMRLCGFDNPFALHRPSRPGAAMLLHAVGGTITAQ